MYKGLLVSNNKTVYAVQLYYIKSMIHSVKRHGSEKLYCINKSVTYVVCVIALVNVLNVGAIRFYKLLKLEVS